MDKKKLSCTYKYLLELIGGPRPKVVIDRQIKRMDIKTIIK
jgi:hypothetical protein